MGQGTLTAKLRRSHRLLAIFIGVQLLIWMISGCYMVLMNIDFIRGNQLVEQPTRSLAVQNINLNPMQIAQRYPHSENITLYITALGPRYKLQQANTLLAISAQDGSLLPALTQQQAETIAKDAYQGQHPWRSSILFQQQAPTELSPRWLPAWQINFGSDSLYVSAITAEVVTKRHDYWRLFDVMWMLHIMDYQERENIHNWLLTLASSLALLMALSGLWLIYVRFVPRKEQQRGRKYEAI